MQSWIKAGLSGVVFSWVSMAAPAYAVTPGNTVKVSRVTGATPAGEALPNPNQTHTNYKVYATDLGIMWDRGNGEIFALFGDTYGQGWGGNGAGPRNADWRSNVLARSSDSNLADGLTFSTMIMDVPGHAKELLASKKINNDEETVIPTAGVAVGTRHYIHYMSVHHWGAAGMWYTNYAGIAYSDDGGQNWVKDPYARWINNSAWSHNFQMAAFAKSGGYVYMFGTPNGRLGDVYLARVPENSLLTKSAYRYWNGNLWDANEAAARPVAKGQAGELSVAYNSYHGRWLMTYLNEARQAIVMRDAPSLTGPWNGEKIVARSSAYPGLYGAFIHPWSMNGSSLYFLMSQWTPYNVFLMRSTLTSDTAGNNVVSDAGFEDQLSAAASAPWFVEGNGGIDRNVGFARSGANNGFVRNASGWNAMKQHVVVQPYTDYTLSGWVRTASNNTEGYFGARAPNGGVIRGETKFGNLANYSYLSVTFNSGANAVLELYAGMWANNGDTWIQMDDISLVPAANLIADAGYEFQASSGVSTPWYVEGTGGIDRNLGFAHSGANNAYLRRDSGWNAVKQLVRVEPNKIYTLKGWVRTAENNTAGYFGARAPNLGAILNETSFASLPGYTQLIVQFNSGANDSVEVYAGMWANNGDTWIQVDDFSLTKN